MRDDERIESILTIQHRGDLSSILSTRFGRLNRLHYSIPCAHLNNEMIQQVIKAFHIVRIVETERLSPIDNVVKDVHFLLGETKWKDYIEVYFNKDDVNIHVYTDCADNERAKIYEKIYRQVYEDFKKTYTGFIPVAVTYYLKVGNECDCNTVSLKLSEDYDKYVPMKNYHHTTEIQLRKLEELLQRDNYMGKIILFEGPPGTGKTFYIKRLVSMLFQYFHDKKNKFYGVKYYLGEGVTYLGLRDCVSRNILIFEDADFILDTSSQRSRTFLKILNLSSGFLDVNSLFIFSSNLPIKKVDDAFSRNGRMIGRVHFGEFSKIESIKWLRNNGYPEDELAYLADNGDLTKCTLADLYSLVLKFKKIEVFEDMKIGFVDDESSPQQVEEAKSPR